MYYRYRITKYNPAFRSGSGAYLKNDWTAYSDIGRAFCGKILSEAEYLDVEAAYLSTVLDFITEAGLAPLTIRGLENHWAVSVPDFVFEGNKMNAVECVDFARLVLREIIWGRLVGRNRTYIHFGSDYYMYIGLSSKCPSAIANAKKRGLFVEPFRSPYLRAYLGKKNIT